MRVGLQYLSMAVSLAALALIFRRWRRAGRWMSSVPSALWLLHVLAFYVYVLGYKRGWWQPAMISSTWSAAITLHGVATNLLYQALPHRHRVHRAGGVAAGNGGDDGH